MTEELKLQSHDDPLVRAGKRQIFLAACRVRARKSFHQAAVKEMALEAGLAAGSIYVYLQSKDDILLLLAESMIAELLHALPTLRAQSKGDPRRELLAIMRASLDVIDRHREAFAVLNHEVRYLARRPQYRSALNQITSGYKGALADVLERGRAMGVIRFDSIPTVVEAIHILYSGWPGPVLPATSYKETHWHQITPLHHRRPFAPTP